MNGANDWYAVRSWLLIRLAVSWTWVGLPLAWGVWQTVVKSLRMFE